MSSAIRLILLLVALTAAAIFIAFHGIRAIGILIVIALAITVPKTRVWRWIESGLVWLTGSRQRALLLVMVVVLAGALAFTVIPLVVNRG